MSAKLVHDIARAIEELRDGRGPSRTATVDLLKRAHAELLKVTCMCEMEACKYPLCHANKESAS